MMTGLVGTGFPLLPLPAAAAPAWEEEDAPAADFLSDLLEAAVGDDALSF